MHRILLALFLLIGFFYVSHTGYSQHTGAVKFRSVTVNSRGENKIDIDSLDIVILKKTSGDTIVSDRYNNKSEIELPEGEYTLTGTYKNQVLTKNVVIKAYQYTFVDLEFYRKWWWKK